MLVGNKRDLGQQRMVETAEGAAYAEENGLLFKEASAKSREDVNDLFLDLARNLPRDQVAGLNGIRPGHSASGKRGTCCITRLRQS